MGTTPSQYVLHVRVEAARRQLERTAGGLKQVASAACFGITPSRYRELAGGR